MDILLLTLVLSLLLPGAAALVVRSLARVHPQLGAGTYLAELAENSYWFRNATTNNESTLLSIPVILSGTLPKQRPFPLPLFREYPRNLFSLLSGSHELKIRENVTGLNPRRTAAPFVPRFRLLVEDLSVAYLHLLLPTSWASRWLPPVTQTWNQFLNPGAPGPIRRTWKDFRVDWSRRAGRFRNFVGSIRGDGPTALYFLHSMLPHASWIYLPSGKRTSFRPWWRCWA